MSVEFIGVLSAREQSEALVPSATAIDHAFIHRLARAHETAGFDRVLVRTSSGSPDAAVLASWVLTFTEQLGVLIAHRPGFVSPTVAARTLATLDQLSSGRVAVHIVTGGDSRDLARDGDFLDHDERYLRAEEYVTVLKRAWTSRTTFDFSGRYYRLVGYEAPFPCLTQPHVPVYVGGASEHARNFAARQADVFASWGEPLRDIAAQISASDARAREHGRLLRHSLSVRPILAAREQDAWDKAHEILDTIRSRGLRRPVEEVENVGSRRLLAAARRGDVLDRCLFMPLVEATGARGNATALVGTAETVADALVDYANVGITTFIIAGFALGGAEADVAAFGELIRQVRARV